MNTLQVRLIRAADKLLLFLTACSLRYESPSEKEEEEGRPMSRWKESIWENNPHVQWRAATSPQT